MKRSFYFGGKKYMSEREDRRLVHKFFLFPNGQNGRPLLLGRPLYTQALRQLGRKYEKYQNTFFFLQFLV